MELTNLVQHTHILSTMLTAQDIVDLTATIFDDWNLWPIVNRLQP
jgi:hypothetical protein